MDQWQIMENIVGHFDDDRQSVTLTATASRGSVLVLEGCIPGILAAGSAFGPGVGLAYLL